MLIPKVTEVIRTDKELPVKLFYKGAPIQLQSWFRHIQGCKLDRKSMRENFLQIRKPYFKIFLELNAST